MTQSQSSKERSPIQNLLYNVIFKSDTPLGKRFDVFLLWVIVLSIVLVVIESVGVISDLFYRELKILEWFFSIFFALEYAVRLWVSKNTRKYALSYLGIIDLLSFLPTFLTLFIPGGQYFLVVRGLRLLRVFRILKMVQYIKELRILIRSIQKSLPKISIFMLFIVVLVTILGSIMYLIEGEQNGFTDIPNSIYWAIVTLATVGYGDITPVTPMGKMLASFIILVGYGIIAVPTGILTSELIKESQILKPVKTKAQKKGTKACPQCQCKDIQEHHNYCYECGSLL